MNDIKVPFLPISDFDPSDILENLADASEEEKESDVMPSMIIPELEKKTDNITLILIGMGMEKYVKLFQTKNISLDTFLKLNECDLEEIGITDPEDRKTIFENVGVHQKQTNGFNIPENHTEDLHIIQNISCRLALLQAYSYYVNLQMLKNNFTDYKISDEETACTYLKSFTESALVQSQILSQAIYNEQNMDGLLNIVCKECNMTKILNKRFHNKKRKKKFFKIVAVVGFFALFILTKKYLIRKCKQKGIPEMV